MVDPLHHSSLLYAVYMTVIVETLSALQYQTVVCAFDVGGLVPDEVRLLKTQNITHCNRRQVANYRSSQRGAYQLEGAA